MISVHEAKTIVSNCVVQPTPVELPLAEVFALTLAQDVIAVCDVPAYAQSSMDGFAISYASHNTPLRVVAEIAAGCQKQIQIQTGEAARIFTGAPLPRGADTVVMQEKTTLANELVTIDDPLLQQGSNVRPQGSEIKSGEVAMPARFFLGAAALGFLAGIGISKVHVFPKPAVTIILTGNELQTQGEPLAFGKVYDSNSIMLAAALKQAGIEIVSVLRAEDDLKQLQEVMNTALNSSNIVLLTGGVSVGNYDFVTTAAEACGIQKRFHRVRQKPGKPLYFGMKDEVMVFGLPGNPSSALTCFYVYVLPAIKTYLGISPTDTSLAGKLDASCKKVPGLTQFMKAHYENGLVTLLHAQESFRLHSFARANCIAELDESFEYLNAGDQVKIHMIPGHL